LGLLLELPAGLPRLVLPEQQLLEPLVPKERPELVLPVQQLLKPGLP
jgi:hypothetical protein